MNVIAGQVGDERGLSKAIPSMAGPRAPFVHIAAAMKRETGLAVFHATRITDLATAEHCVREGWVDMVAMTRAHMADPHIVAKMMRGEEDRIRPCVGAGYCLDRIYIGGDALCLHNPATGRERTMPHVDRARNQGPRRKVVVVGAGPAGLEAARVSALRGHEVVVFEAASEPGGQIVLAARATWRKDLLGVAQWLASEAERLGVTLHLNRYVDVQDVVDERPDIVVVATGGVPNTDWVDGAEHVVSVWDVLGGHVEPGAEVLVYDDHGDHQGPSVVDFLATRGSKVELVTPDRMAAHEVGATNYPVYLDSFYTKGVRMTPDLPAAQRGARRQPAARGASQRVQRRGGDPHRRPGGGRTRYAASRGALPRARAHGPQRGGTGHRSADRGARAGHRVERGGRVHAVPGRGRGGEPEHSRSDLRFPSAVQGVLRAGGPRVWPWKCHAIHRGQVSLARPRLFSIVCSRLACNGEESMISPKLVPTIAGEATFPPGFPHWGPIPAQAGEPEATGPSLWD